MTVAAPVRRVLWEDPSEGLVLDVDDRFDLEFVQLLEATQWGTDGPLYRTLDVAPDLARLEDARFLTLRAHGVLVGVYVLIPRTVTAPGGPITAYHRGALAVRSDQARLGRGRILVEQARRHFLDAGTGRRCAYGYIDADNGRMLQLARKAGYQRLGTLHPTPFSRRSPRDDPRAGPLRPDEVATVVEHLRHRYGQHALFDASVSVRAEETWVLREGDAIVASVQVVPRTFRFVRLPGVLGWLVVRLGHRVPGLASLLDPRAWRHLWLTALWSAADREEDLLVLLEAVLARHEVTAGLAWLDPRVPLHAWMLGGGKLGPLHAAGFGGNLHVMAGFREVPQDEIEGLERRPIWVSALDAV